MIIANEIRTRRVELVPVEYVKEHYPGVRILIRTETEEIKAAFDHAIWLSEQEVDNFIRELEFLDANRTGKATLESLSPGELRIEFEAIDLLGHLSFRIFVSRQHLHADHSYLLEIAFEIDPTCLAELRYGFVQLMG